ncbi:hypothetical protein MUU53_21045 [Rhizobium lemnae]|uniref:Uncharacterized protein n=1 Tax=Rhizobium lemnae TaxID=1214924 RepID=A0ABV8ED71_9HYPH|nr:hypothetical protein [Rhizobium lemnae]MCJ8510373.1 hypothetical protein [Rhizobium lemnae]
MSARAIKYRERKDGIEPDRDVGRRVRFILTTVMAGLTGVGIIVGAALWFGWFSPSGQDLLSMRKMIDPRCSIRGIISPVTKERIYFGSGQLFNHFLRGNDNEQEQWFCSEAEARAAGYSRAD